MRRHYHVLQGTPGYMPDVNHVCRTLHDAQTTARWQAREWKDDDPEFAYHVTGNVRDGYTIATPGLDTRITIQPCYEVECLEELEE